MTSCCGQLDASFVTMMITWQPCYQGTASNHLSYLWTRLFYVNLHDII